MQMVFNFERITSFPEYSMRLSAVAALAVFALLALVVAPGLAADKPDVLIVGKWQPKDEKAKVVLDFQKDNKLKISADESFSFDGTYKFVNDTTLEIKIAFGGQEKVTKLKVTITKDELTTQEEGKDKKETFVRVKG